MKIDRLYTLSQFVDWIAQTDKDHQNLYGNKELYKEAEEKCISMVVLIADKIIDYNSFLKQPLKKEMFVNEIEKPKRAGYSDDESLFYHEQLQKWQEAEKKVIFEGWKQSITFKYDVLLNGIERLDFSNSDYPKYQKETVQTLLELTEKTNGQLKLKNVEI